MSRFSSFARGLSASWVATAVVTVYSLSSVPLAIHHLGAEQFGLWVLLLQIQGYFALIEIGMTGACGRLLIDHKDSSLGLRYIETLSTSNIIFVAQAALIVVAGWLSAPALVQLFDIPAAYRDDFTILLKLASSIAALGILIRFSGALLYAHQRLDLLNYSSILSTLIALATMWLALDAGAGLYALLVSQFAAWATGAFYGIGFCYRLKFFRWRDLHTETSWARAKELLNFGKDMFAFNVGSQLLDASQIMIVTKTMGLQSAAIWAISSKLFTLVTQLVLRMQGVAMVYFAEMIVRGEKSQLQRRFRNVYQVSASLAVSAAAVVVATNSSFVSLWVEPSLAWTYTCNILFAILVAVNCCCRCGAELIIHTKNMAGLRFIYFIEGAIFVALAAKTAVHAGFAGILLAALFCAFAFRGSYVAVTASRFLGVESSCFFFFWLKRAVAVGALTIPAAAGISYGVSTHGFTPSIEFGLALLTSSVLAAFVFIFLGCPVDVRKELQERLLRLLGKYRNAVFD